MKKSILVVVACVLFGISNAQESKVNTPENNSQPAETEFTVVSDKSEHDFGTISESGGVVNCEFAIKNTGTKPLVITKVTTSCGCTASEWTKEPVASGKQGLVKVTFDPKGRKGEMIRTLVVFTNGKPESLQLKIKGSVI